MSRRSRRNRYKQQRPVQNGPTMKAADAFTNSLAYLGGANELEKANDYTRRSITASTELLTVLYRENWLAKRIIDTPCDDMTRAWYDLETAVEQEQLDKFFKAEDHHNVKQEITDAIRWARLYGGAVAIMVIKGQEDMLDQPLDYDMLMPGCFKGLLVVDKAFDITAGDELEDDMDDPDFGEPLYYDVTVDRDSAETVRIHHSRLLVFKGRRLPKTEEAMERYWGASELEHIYEELQRMDATSANIAQLVFQANLRTLKVGDYGEALAMGTDQQVQALYKMLERQNRIMNSQGVQLLGAEDSMEQHPYTFTGIAEMYEKFCMNMAGAAEIPATKLFGRSPEGMNATGESDMKNYYSMISQLQERILKPALEKLLPVMFMSEWGKVPDDYDIVFNPIDSPTPTERAGINAQLTGTVIQAFNGGLISQKTALKELISQGTEIGAWGKISPEDVEKASDEVDSGEEMEDPMAGGDPMGMGGMPGEGPQMPPEAAQAPAGGNMPPMPPEAPQEPTEPQPEQDSLTRTYPPMNRFEVEEDGGPGSGNFNHPGYPRGGGSLNPPPAPTIPKAPAAPTTKITAPKAPSAQPPKTQMPASFGQRAKFLTGLARHEDKPVEKGTDPRPAQQVSQANRERKEWNNLSTSQKVQGASEQNRHMAQVKGEAVKAAIKGDLPKAQAIVNKNEHYWSHSPEAAAKVQSETLQRQKKARPLMQRLFNRH